MAQSVRAGSVGRVGVVRGRLVGAVVRIVAKAVTVLVTDTTVATQTIGHDEGQCIAGAAIGIGGGHRIQTRCDSIEASRLGEGVIPSTVDSRQRERRWIS